MSLEFPEDSLDYYINNYEPGELLYQETMSEVWNHCVLESLLSIYSVVARVIFINFCFGFITSAVTLPEYLFHALSGTTGLYLVISTLQSLTGKTVIISCFISTYFFLHHGSYNQRFYTFLKYMIIVVLFLCEYCLLDPEVWLEIRGVAMVFSMKFISLVADIGEKKIAFPSFIQYFGYMFSGANIMFGPWINYEQYILQYKHPSKKNFWWIYGITKSLLLAIFFLSLSNCWTSYLISERANKFLTGYKEALIFRTSHYFICYLSEASIVAAGWKNFRNWYDEENWGFTIVRPADIEFPASLPIVVANWNVPMHDFLKKYIYCKWVPLGRFPAILITFVISSFLHGFEIKVSVVLITIGLFHYIQVSLRKNISQTFDICAGIFTCRTCKHSIKRNHLPCKILMFVFSILTVIHLIFLGVLMDPSTDEVGILKKWDDLYYISFWIIFIDILIVQS